MAKSQRLSNLPNAPAFSAYAASSQSISASTFTKVNFGTEAFDTNSNFASSRFTPTVSGYYILSCAVDISATTSITRAIANIYKNGADHKRLFDSGSSTNTLGGSALVYFNGSTDYAEVYAYVTGTSPTISAGETYTWFQGVLVRPAA